MKNFSLKQWCKAAAFLMVLLISSSSCNKEDELDYLGTWARTENIPVKTGFIGIRDVMTLTETSFENLVQMQMDNDLNFDIASMKGSMTVTGNRMNHTVTEVGMTSFNSQTGIPFGPMVYYKEGSIDFVSKLLEMDQPKTFQSEYSVSGDQLTIKTDLNKDGDFSDELEVTVYTKQ